MKTTREYLESIADPELREAALRNMESQDRLRLNLVDALFASMDWIETPEGAAFWSAIVDFYEYGGEPTYSQFKHLIQ